MRSLLLLLLLSANSFAQIHQDLPLPEINEDKSSVKIIDENIVGWSKSLDGQWISSAMTIPVQAISKDEASYESDEGLLGMDNIDELHLYKTQYGDETVYIFVKVSRFGYYKYAATQQKWQSTKTAYYYAFAANHLNKLKNISEKTSIIKIPLMDYGSLGEIKTKYLVDELRKKLIIRENTNRNMVTTIKTDSEHPDKVYFQISSQHVVLPDVEGVLHDFTLEGGTIYGSPLLLDYLHYEYNKDAFYKFFSAE